MRLQLPSRCAVTLYRRLSLFLSSRCYDLAMPRYRISFITKQLYYDEVEADSPEEALKKHEENPDYILGDWNEVQPDSYEVEEIK